MKPMVITRCPRCGERVRVPSAAAEARVQCPWCTEHYELAEALETLPPPLVVLEEGPAAFATGIGLELEEPSGADDSGTDDNEYFLRDAEADNASFQAIDARRPAAGGDDAASGAIRTRPVRRKKPSAIWMLTQWVGGGVAGVAIAVGILWYLDRLPETELFSWLDRIGWPGEAQLQPAQPQPTLEELGVDDEPETEFAMPQPVQDEPEGIAGEQGAGGGVGQLTPPFALDANDPAAAEGGPGNAAANEPPTPDREAGGTAPTEAPRGEEEAAPQASTDEDFVAFRQALDRASELQNAHSEAARRAFLEAYQQLAAIGATSDSRSIDSPPLHALLRRAADIEGLLEAFAETAPRWIELGPRRSNAGIVAVGRIGAGMPPTLQLPSGSRIEMEASASQGEIPSDERAILVGKLVEPPELETTSANARAIVGAIHVINE